MTVQISLAQANGAAAGNAQLRETLTALILKTQQYDTALGLGQLTKVDASTIKASAPPPQSSLSVVGANGSFTVTITLPQQATGAPQNSSKGVIYQEVSSSSAADFSNNVTTYPLSTGTSFLYANPGATLYWRLRSSYDQRTFNSYSRFNAAVSAGLQSSAATEPNNPLNQSNFCTVDSIAAGGSATVRVYGSGGPGTSWTSILGTNSKVLPAGTILNIPYASDLYVAYDGSKYQTKPSLTQVFPDGWIPVGKVSVIANGSGLVLPTFSSVVASDAVVAVKIDSAGNGMTSAPILTFSGGAGSGAAAVCSISAGAVTGVTVTNSGSGYTSNPTVTASGGVSGGAGGGGGPQGVNSGRLYGGTT